MFYSGVPAPNRNLCCSGQAWALKSDPVTWHQDEHNPVFSPGKQGWDSGSIRLDAVLYLREEKAYYIYYSGTTAAVAEKLNRRWIACDLGRFAIHTTRKRLLQIPNVKPFVVQNLGKYERQQWITAEFHNPDNRLAQEKAYRDFIIGLYLAQPVKGYVYLHGAKSVRMVHVGAVDAPVSMGDVKAIINEFWKSVGKSKEIARNGIDVLGWDFAFEMNEVAKQQAASANIQVRFLRIPHDAMDKRAVEQGDVRAISEFFEQARERRERWSKRTGSPSPE